MSYLTPISDRRPDRAIDAALIAAIADAEREFQPQTFHGAWPLDGLGIRNLAVRDVVATNQSSGLKGGAAGSAAWGITAVTVSTWTDYINLNTDSRIFVVVTGFFNLSPNPQTTHMRWKANGIDLPLISVQEVYTWDQPRAFLQKPVIVRPTNNLTVRVLTKATISGVPAEEIGLEGYTIGERNYLIAES